MSDSKIENIFNVVVSPFLKFFKYLPNNSMVVSPLPKLFFAKHLYWPKLYFSTFFILSVEIVSSCEIPRYDIS